MTIVEVIVSNTRVVIVFINQEKSNYKSLDYGLEVKKS